MEEFVTVKDKKFYCPECKKYRLKVRDGAVSQDGLEVICKGCLKKIREEIVGMKKELAKWKEGYDATQEILENDPFKTFGIKNPFEK